MNHKPWALKLPFLPAIVHALLPVVIKPVWLIVAAKNRWAKLAGKGGEKKKVLLVCQNIVAADHLLPIVAMLQKEKIIELNVVNDHFPSQEINKGQIRKMLGVRYRSVLGALFVNWDLIIYVNHPWGFGSWFWPGTKKVYINHGLYAGKINNALGEDGVYGRSRTTRPHRGLLYHRMFAASNAEKAAALNADPSLDGRIVVVGSMMADHIVSLKNEKARLRSEFGISDGCRVIHVISTWGADSLAATFLDELMGRLHSAHSGIKVLLSVHPRFDKFGGVGRSRSELLEYWHARGVVVDRDNTRWKKFLAIADFAIADHSSLALYHSVLDRPVLLVPVRREAYLSGSPYDVMRHTAISIKDITHLDKCIDAALGGNSEKSLSHENLVEHSGHAEELHMREIKCILSESE